MTIDQSDQKRRFHHLLHEATAELSCDDQRQPCQVIDISLNGCLLRFETPWQQPLEKLYTLNLALSESTAIIMELSVSHVIDDTAGFKSEHIDAESISKLKHIVELKLGDCSLLERDLLALTEAL